MSFEAWSVFAVFWVAFVITPGPNAVNCISNSMQLGFVRALLGVAAILTQATAFLILSALGVTALIAASETGFMIAKYIGAAWLIWLGIKGLMNAGKPAPTLKSSTGSIYGRAFVIAVINPKSVAGYLAAFSQFVQPNVPIRDQMAVIMPTALVLTTLSYCGFTALDAGLGRAALGAVFNVWFRRAMAVCFIIYGALLGIAQTVSAP